MRKLFLILLLSLFFTIFLCSCSETSQSETFSSINTSVEEYSGFSVEKIGDVVKVMDPSGNQLGDDYDSFQEINMRLFASEIAFEGPYYSGAITDGTRLSCDIFFPSGYFSKTEEIPNTKYRIHNSLGVPVTDIYFEDFAFSEKDSRGNEGFDALYGCLEGNKYCYEFKNGEFTLNYIDKAGETGKEAFGLKETQYYYSVWQKGIGLNDAHGNVLIEPIHSRIDVPVSDRLIIYTGYQAHNSYPNEQLAHITDISGNIFASFSYIDCSTFDQGYVWIAYYCGDENHTMERYNKDASYLGKGYWFIDKNGNLLSERFLSLTFKSYGGEDYRSQPSKPTDIATAITESGETITFSIEKYLCES